MKAERLAEWQKFAEDARGALIRGEGTKLGQDGMMAFVELIDALTAERARAEKALKLASIITCDIEGECIVDLAVYRQRIKELDCERMGRDEN